MKEAELGCCSCGRYRHDEASKSAGQGKQHDIEHVKVAAAKTVASIKRHMRQNKKYENNKWNDRPLSL